VMQPEFAGFVALWALACALMIIRRGPFAPLCTKPGTDVTAPRAGARHQRG
jgi:hypothetical protein